MDEILQRFENTLNTARTEDDQSHKDMYKNWGKYGNQEERRSEILRQQKSNRENKLDKCRGILSLMECAEEDNRIFENSSRARYRPSVYVPGFNSAFNYYNNVLMLSEWIVEKPEDFSTNWFVTPCPKGTRTLVIACNGMTRFYTKYGQLIFTTSTLLPGGNCNEKRKKCSVLDCFFCKDINTLYVLDILSWNNVAMTDGDMEFRNYWLQTKFMEEPGLEKITKRNKVMLSLLPMIPCKPDSLKQFMMAYPPLMSAKLDGLLFYHKSGHYVAGETPLVGWLYPYMVPEVLGPDITIHESYEATRPKDYVNQATFIQKFEERFSKKRTPFSKGNKSAKEHRNYRKKTQSLSETSMEAEDGLVAQATTVENITTENIAQAQEINTTRMEAENTENEQKPEPHNVLKGFDLLEHLHPKRPQSAG